MTDNEIIALYFQRDERAIEETRAVYGAFLYRIAKNILLIHEDSEECVADTYVAAWNRMPPDRPAILSAFLSKITRRISIDRLRYRTALKRTAEQTLSFDELEEVVAGGSEVYEQIEAEELSKKITYFLLLENEDNRRAFLLRYFYCESIKEISGMLHLSESKVKSMLYQTRQRLKRYLRKEGVLDEK